MTQNNFNKTFLLFLKRQTIEMGWRSERGSTKITQAIDSDMYVCGSWTKL
eukprot:m.171376 g.171376  ORF g.171376 m.171376 type:complete len:50 (+) comp31648_c0_seq1:132-281(+)